MSDYEYVRDLVDGSYDINNSLRVDDQGIVIMLAHEIEAALPGKSFKVLCDGSDCVVSFLQVTLTVGEKTTLDQVVQDHKDNA